MKSLSLGWQIRGWASFRARKVQSNYRGVGADFCWDVWILRNRYRYTDEMKNMCLFLRKPLETIRSKVIFLLLLMLLFLISPSMFILLQKYIYDKYLYVVNSYHWISSENFAKLSPAQSNSNSIGWTEIA